MKLTRRTSNILLAIGIYTFVVWGTRFFTFLDQFRAGVLVAPAVHFFLVVTGLVIAGYLTYLGVKGRRATRRGL